MNIGDKIKALRKEKDWTLKDLSKRTNLSISYISDIENGRTNPSIDSLKALAKSFGVKASYFLDEEPLNVFQLSKKFLRDEDGGFEILLDGDPISQIKKEKILKILQSPDTMLIAETPSPYNLKPTENNEDPSRAQIAANMEGKYGEKPSPELVELIREVLREELDGKDKK